MAWPLISQSQIASQAHTSSKLSKYLFLAPCHFNSQEVFQRTQVLCVKLSVDEGFER